jgi:hypothetical protein
MVNSSFLWTVILLLWMLSYHGVWTGTADEPRGAPHPQVQTRHTLVAGVPRTGVFGDAWYSIREAFGTASKAVAGVFVDIVGIVFDTVAEVVSEAF